MKFEVKNGCFRYKITDKKIIENISLDVRDGDVLSVLGPNGSGKTTLLRCALGMLRWESGESLLDGADIRHIQPRQMWRKIAYVPQARQAVSPYSVEDTVLLGRTAYRGALEPPKSADYEAADRVIAKMQLEHIRRRRCNELSGGELQMVLIARAMAAEPSLLVLDEPESNLDFRNQLLVLDTISELARGGMACIFNTHYPAHALRRSGKALLIGRDGHTVSGTTAEVVTESNIRRYFGVNAVIGDIETDGNIYRDVVAVSVDHTGAAAPERAGSAANADSTVDAESAPAIATLSIIMSDSSAAHDVNAIIHRAKPYVVGRMGMPLHDAGLNIINLIVEAPPAEIRAIADALGLIPGVSVKATFAKGGNT